MSEQPKRNAKVLPQKNGASAQSWGSKNAPDVPLLPVSP